MAGDSSWSEKDNPAAWIPCYRIVLFLDDGRSSIIVIDAAGDDDALALAIEIAKGRAFELWDALTRIGSTLRDRRPSFRRPTGQAWRRRYSRSNVPLTMSRQVALSDRLITERRQSSTTQGAWCGLAGAVANHSAPSQIIFALVLSEEHGMASDPESLETGRSVAWRSAYRAVLSLDDDRSSIVIIDAPNDGDALALMSWIAEGRAFELWNGPAWIGQSPLR